MKPTRATRTMAPRVLEGRSEEEASSKLLADARSPVLVPRSWVRPATRAFSVVVVVSPPATVFTAVFGSVVATAPGAEVDDETAPSRLVGNTMTGARVTGRAV